MIQNFHLLILLHYNSCASNVHGPHQMNDDDELMSVKSFFHFANPLTAWLYRIDDMSNVVLRAWNISPLDEK